MTTTSAAALTLDTPDGPFSLITDDASVLASGWTEDLAELLALVHGSLRPEAGAVHLLDEDAGSGPRAAASAQDAPTAAVRTARAAAQAVRAYYAGDPSAVRTVPVRQHSGDFRTHAWEVLRTVAPGEQITYTEYARRSGRPAAVRAAAGACAMNAAALFVPCHRIVRTDGSLGGFRYGLDVKRSLLAREAAAG